MIRIAGGETLRYRAGGHRAAAAMPSRCASMPRTRRRISCRSPAPSARFAFPAATACASTPCSIPAIRSRPSTIRCWASSSCGTRTASRRHRAPGAGARRARDRRPQDDQAACIRRWPPMRTSRQGDFHTRWLERWLEAQCRSGSRHEGGERHHEDPIFLWRRRAHLRRGRRGDVARGLLQEPVDDQRGARRARSRASPRSARPTPRSRSSSIPT